MTQKFLGRTFDPKTHTYSFEDGTGTVPEEMRQDLFEAIEQRNAICANGLAVLATLFAWKQRLETNSGYQQ